MESKPNRRAHLKETDTIRLIQAYAAPRCQHLKTNGLRCASPALRQGKYCFFHNNLRTAPREIVVPALEDADAVQLAVQQVVRGVLNGLLESKTAGVALYGLQLASANLKNTTFEPRMRDGCTDPATLATIYDPSGSGAEPECDYDDDDEGDDGDDEQEDEDHNGEDEEEEDEEGETEEQEDDNDDDAADAEQDDADDTNEDDDAAEQDDADDKAEVDPRLQPGDTTANPAAASAAEVTPPSSTSQLPDSATVPPATPQLRDSATVPPATPAPAPLSILRAYIEQSIAELPAAGPVDPPALSRKAIRSYRRVLKSLNAAASRPLASGSGQLLLLTRDPRLLG